MHLKIGKKTQTPEVPNFSFDQYFPLVALAIDATVMQLPTIHISTLNASAQNQFQAQQPGWSLQAIIRCLRRTDQTQPRCNNGHSHPSFTATSACSCAHLPRCNHDQNGTKYSEDFSPAIGTPLTHLATSPIHPSNRRCLFGSICSLGHIT